MKKIAILLFLLTFISCYRIKENISSQKDWEEIKSSNDLFRFSTFIIEHPNSNYIDKAIKRQMILRDSLYKPSTYFQDYYSRFVSIYCKKDTFFIKHQPVKIDSIKKETYEYLINIESEMPERRHIEDELERKIWNSYAFGRIAFLIDTVNADITYYSKPIEQVAEAMQQYKIFLSKKLYKTDISELDKDQKQTIENISSTKLEFWHEIMFSFAKPIPPLPPPAPLP